MAVKARAPDNLQHQVFHTLDLWRKRDKREATLEKLNQTLKELGWISVMTQIRNTPDNFYVVTSKAGSYFIKKKSLVPLYMYIIWLTE